MDLLHALKIDTDPKTFEFPVGGGAVLIVEVAPATPSNAAFQRARVRADADLMRASRDLQDADEDVRRDALGKVEADNAVQIAADGLLVGWRSGDGRPVTSSGSEFPPTPENRLKALKASPELLEFVQRKAVAARGFVADADAEAQAVGNSPTGSFSGASPLTDSASDGTPTREPYASTPTGSPDT